VTLGAAILGVMLSGAVSRGAPFEGLLYTPFTMVGADIVLVPTYLWARHVKAWTRAASYIAVPLAGLVGSSALLALLVRLAGGLTAAVERRDGFGA
jgi:hypothetical protein